MQTLDKYLKNPEKQTSPYNHIKNKLLKHIKKHGRISLTEAYKLLKKLGLKKAVFLPLCELWEEHKIKPIEDKTGNIFFIVEEGV